MVSPVISLAGMVEGTSAAKFVPHVAAAATSQGFKVAAPVPGTLMLTRSFRPGWVGVVVMLMVLLAVGSGAVGAPAMVIVWVIIAVAVIAFARSSETVSLVVTDGAGGADVSASGAASGELAEFVTGLLPAL